jgi:hypothetical protein
MTSKILKNSMDYISEETMSHPSLSESLLNAYEDSLGKCTKLVKNTNILAISFLSHLA